MWVNPNYIQNGVSSLRLGGLQSSSYGKLRISFSFLFRKKIPNVFEMRAALKDQVKSTI